MKAALANVIELRKATELSAFLVDMEDETRLKCEIPLVSTPTGWSGRLAVKRFGTIEVTCEISGRLQCTVSCALGSAKFAARIGKPPFYHCTKFNLGPHVIGAVLIE